MTDCKHLSAASQGCHETVLGESFAFKAEVCGECGSVAWTNATYEQFFSWLETLHREKPDKFTLQKVRLPRPVWEYIGGDLQREVRGDLNLSAVIKAATWIYIKMVARDPAFSREIEGYFNKQDRDFVSRGEGDTKFRFNPKFFLEIHHWAKRLKMTEKEFVENAVTRVIYGAKWHDEIKRSLIDRLEAA